MINDWNQKTKDAFDRRLDPPEEIHLEACEDWRQYNDSNDSNECVCKDSIKGLIRVSSITQY